MVLGGLGDGLGLLGIATGCLGVGAGLAGDTLGCLGWVAGLGGEAGRLGGDNSLVCGGVVVSATGRII
jgi:hypothetical protein